MELEKKRVSWVDVAKGLCILLVIAVHTVKSNRFADYFNGWVIPLFFAINGYFFKDSDSFKDVCQKIKKDFFHLYVPSAAVYALCFLPVIALWSDSKSVFECISYCIEKFVFAKGLLWFVVALFWARLFYRIALHKKLEKPIFLLYLLLFAYFLAKKGLVLPQKFSVIPIVCFFIYMGRLYKKHESSLLKYENILVFILFPIWIYMYLADYSTNIAWEGWSVKNFLTYPYTCFGIFLGIQLCKALDTVDLVQKPLVWIGKNSFILLCIHHIEHFIFGDFGILVSKGSWCYASVPEKYWPVLLLTRILANLLILFVVTKFLDFIKKRSLDRINAK